MDLHFCHIVVNPARCFNVTGDVLLRNDVTGDVLYAWDGFAYLYPLRPLFIVFLLSARSAVLCEGPIKAREFLFYFVNSVALFGQQNGR